MCFVDDQPHRQLADTPYIPLVSIDRISGMGARLAFSRMPRFVEWTGGGEHKVDDSQLGVLVWTNRMSSEDDLGRILQCVKYWHVHAISGALMVPAQQLRYMQKGYIMKQVKSALGRGTEASEVEKLLVGLKEVSVYLSACHEGS